MYALITGASSGIGQEFARQLAAKHYDLILVARRKDRLLELKKELSLHYSIHVKILSVNLSDREQCILLHKKVQHHPISLVINNAGFGKADEFTNIALSDELEMIDTNVVAVHTLTKLFAKSMKHGYILNVASIAAFTPVPMMATYGATKAYVLHLSRAINYELRKHKKRIRVVTLCPGPVKTEFNQVAGVTYDLKGISASSCVRIALQELSKGKELIIPSATTKTMHCLLKIVPSFLALPVEYILQSKKLV